MSVPVWVTPAGNLGTIPEGIFYQQPLLADTPVLSFAPTCTATNSVNNAITCTSTAGIYPDLNVMFTGLVFGGISIYVRYFVKEVLSPTEFTIKTTEFSTQTVPLTTATGVMGTVFTQHVYYTLQAGSLPPGVSCTDNGLIQGVPKAVASLQGVPLEVSRNVTSKFAIRGYTKTASGVVDGFSDRTFSLTVTGQNRPQFVTPAGNIGTYYDGSYAAIQIEIKDNDPDDTQVISVAAGELPPGLTVTPKGLISGYIQPLIPIEDAAGFSRDRQGFDQYNFDFSPNSASRYYQFTLEVTDGKESDLRTYDIYVYSRSSLTADTLDFTADNTYITADESPIYVPYIQNSTPSFIGTYRSDNFFAYQFIGVDLNGLEVEFQEFNDSTGKGLPPGIQLDQKTGWLYGYIPDLGAVEITYDFGILIREASRPEVVNDPYYFSMTVVGQISSDVVWISPSDLGTIDNGDVSLFSIEAINTGGRSLQYRLEPGGYPAAGSGVYNKLPQGLQLLDDGNISGRVSFNTFALDGGTTTFDTRPNTRLQVDPTTFDMSYTFTVNAYSVDGLVNAFKTFTITVNREYNEPYENLYIKAMPPLEDREIISDLLQNQDLIPVENVFRPQDPNFGVATNVIYNHAFGLTSSTYEEYMSSLVINHYWKNLVLGEVKSAQATDANGRVIYEVVYSTVVDDLVNNTGESVSKEVTLPYPIAEGQINEISKVYPNSLVNMRNQVIDVVGQISKQLPLWMLSKQDNGQVLGFVPAWVICYTKPGFGKKIAYNINKQYSDQLNQIDFEVDRYELNRLLSIHWDPNADSVNASWVPQPPAETTFDLVPHYQITSLNGGLGYNIGDQILIPGSVLGGVDGINNQIITVQDVDTSGTILLCNISGQAPILTVGDVYNSITGTNISGTGSGAVFNFEIGSGSATIFDSHSLRFTAPVDKYSNTEEYNKYLVFPRRNILV